MTAYYKDLTRPGAALSARAVSVEPATDPISGSLSGTFGEVASPDFTHDFGTRPLRLYRRAGKRALDVVLVLIFAPIILTVIGILALGVMRDGGKAFYLQPRVGRNGKTYMMWKLRSMVADADARLEAYLDADPDARAEWDHAQKLKADPRITRFGHFLRRSSLDELPQLWNVVKGDMSLVGPRPMMVEQRALYPGRDYYDLRPGITGPWQVSARNATSFADRATFDTAYNRGLSLRADIGYLFKTIRVVIRGTGC